jgi:hypothetical protein
MGWWAVAAIAVVLLAGCTPEGKATTTTTLGPIATVTIAGLPSPTTTLLLDSMPPQSIPTTTHVPRINREAELAIRRCMQAINNDFLPLTLVNGDRTAASGAVALCDEATVQLQVETQSEFVDVLLEQLEGARRAIGLASLAQRFTAEEAVALQKALDGYVARINVRLDEMPGRL